MSIFKHVQHGVLGLIANEFLPAKVFFEELMKVILSELRGEVVEKRMVTLESEEEGLEVITTNEADDSSLDIQH